MVRDSVMPVFMILTERARAPTSRKRLQFFASEAEYWRRIVKDANVTLE
jgi:hypothetical protein